MDNKAETLHCKLRTNRYR